MPATAASSSSWSPSSWCSRVEVSPRSRPRSRLSARAAKPRIPIPDRVSPIHGSTDSRSPMSLATGTMATSAPSRGGWSRDRSPCGDHQRDHEQNAGELAGLCRTRGVVEKKPGDQGHAEDQNRQQLIVERPPDRSPKQKRTENRDGQRAPAGGSFRHSLRNVDRSKQGHQRKEQRVPHAPAGDQRCQGEQQDSFRLTRVGEVEDQRDETAEVKGLLHSGVKEPPSKDQELSECDAENRRDDAETVEHRVEQGRQGEDAQGGECEKRRAGPDGADPDVGHRGDPRADRAIIGQQSGGFPSLRLPGECQPPLLFDRDPSHQSRPQRRCSRNSPMITIGVLTRR